MLAPKILYLGIFKQYNQKPISFLNLIPLHTLLLPLQPLHHDIHWAILEELPNGPSPLLSPALDVWRSPVLWAISCLGKPPEICKGQVWAVGKSGPILGHELYSCLLSHSIGKRWRGSWDTQLLQHSWAFVFKQKKYD